MARQDKNIENAQESQNVVVNAEEQLNVAPASIEAPIESVPVSVMPVDKQMDLHTAHVLNPMAALQPGRPFIQSQGVTGEIEKMANDAEKKGDYATAGKLNSLSLKVGELLVHIRELEKDSADHIKKLYAKVISFFNS